MSYMALYRKFRPAEFDEVKGQDHIVTALKNEIKTQRVGHAYLFCGTRGTGKTTVAKIFAKAVNCEHPVDGSPCNECDTCKRINEQKSLNVVEIDAASNNGVSNIRDIIDEVQYSPTEGKYRVYIIDEVHMLSSGAFNALLKTLEEPPSYVIFILATTEVHKIPITILSRCQRYDFKRISIETISNRLNELIEKEKVEASPEAVRYIAKVADGSMRDALSLLDQCIAFYLGQTLDYDKVLSCLGAVDTAVYEKIFDALVANDTHECINIISDIINNGRDLLQFVNDFIWHLRNVMITKSSGMDKSMLDVSTEAGEILQKQAEQIDINVLIRYIHILSELSANMKYSNQKRVLLEVCFIKLCKPQMDNSQDLNSVISRISVLEKKLDSPDLFMKTEVRTEVITDPKQKQEKEKKEKEQKIRAEALPEDIKNIIKKWNDVKRQLEVVDKIFIDRAKLDISEDSKLILQFGDVTCEDRMHEDEDRLTKTIEKIIEDITGVHIDIVTRCIAEKEDCICDLEELLGCKLEVVD